MRDGLGWLMRKLIKKIRVMSRDEIVHADVPDSGAGSRSVGFGGPDRDRTGYLRHAMAALYQVSYGP